MKTYKAFTDNTLRQGNTQFSIGHTTRTSKPLVLRQSGIHSCTSPEAAKLYYPKNAVIVECEVSATEIGESFNGLIVSKSITPERFIDASQAPNPVTAEDNEESEDEEDDFCSSTDLTEADQAEAESIADELRNLAARLETLAGN